MRSLLFWSFVCLLSLTGVTGSMAQDTPVRLLPEGFDDGGGEEQTQPETKALLRAVDLSTLWGLTPQSLLQSVLPAMPTAPSSQSVYNLQRSLLSASTARIRDKPDVLLPLRIERLLSMGEIDAAATLLRGVPAISMTPELYRLRIDTALLGADPTPACVDLPEILRFPDPDQYLKKVHIFCQILGGKVRDAEQSLIALKGVRNDDPAFFIAAENMIQLSESKESPSLPQPTPLHLTMLRMARMPLPADSIESTYPVILRSIGLSPNAPLETRLRAAEKAEVSGALPTDSVRQLYLSAAIPKQDITMMAASAAKGTARGRVLLFRLALTQTQSSLKVAVILSALEQADSDEARMAALRLYASQIAQIKPVPALVAFAPTAIRSLIADNKGSVATVWSSLLRQQAQNDIEAARHLAGLWPLLRLSDIKETPSWPPGALMAWHDAQSKTEEAVAISNRLFLAASLLSAVGEAIPPEDIIFLLGQNEPDHQTQSPSAAASTAVIGLSRAISENRKGETVLWSLLALRDSGVRHALPTNVLQQIILGLRQAGFEADARLLALETALAAGL